MAEEFTKKNKRTAEEYFETVLKVRRVAKVVKGGRRFAFSALVVVGDKEGSMGFALAKSRDISSAISKSLKKARKSMLSFPLYKTTIPYTVTARHGASKVLLRSASKGTGVIAGGAIRSVMEALGIKDILTKSIGSNNPGNVVKATLKALAKLKSAKDIARIREKTVKEMVGKKDV